MTPREAWRVLGVDPTRDTGAIRRAYATALKAIAPDADPERFNRLRDARDTALGYARTPAEEPDEPDHEWVEEAVMSGDDSRFDTAADYPDPAPAVQVDPHEAAIGAHYQSLVSLLFPNGERTDAASNPDEAARMAEHFGALLDDPRLDHLEFRAGAEDELARLIATALPRSDSLVPIATARFGWDATRGRVDQSPAVRALTDRADTLAFREAVLSPKHPLHSAWRELTKPAVETSRRSFGVRRAKVRELLGTVRTRYPALEGEFDWYRVAMWEAGTSRWRSHWWPYGLALWFGLQILSHVFDDGRSLSRALPLPQRVAQVPGLSAAISGNALTSPDADLGDAVAMATDSRVTLPTLVARQPALVTTLRAKWKTAHDTDVDRTPFVTSVAKYLRQRAAAGQQVAPYDLASQFARAQLEMELFLGSRTGTVELCGAVAGTPAVPAAVLPDAILAHQSALLARALLETDAAPESGRRLFPVPGPVVTAAAARARVPRADFTAAMRGDGTADTRCRARIALLEEALSLPHAQALPLPLLRQL